MSTTTLSPTVGGIDALTAGTWTVDPAHSSVGFTARHLMITKVHGTFRTFSGTFEVAPDPLQSTLEASVDMASVTTGDDKRDEHLRGSDFFDTTKFPTMTFRSTSITPKGDDYRLTGDLTINGVTRPVTFELEFEGVTTDPWGNLKAGFEASAEINRKDWGLQWNVALETGGVLVSDKVQLLLEIQAVKSA